MESIDESIVTMAVIAISYVLLLNERFLAFHCPYYAYYMLLTSNLSVYVVDVITEMS